MDNCNWKHGSTITHDTLDWYRRDEDGGSVHDVIGTRCHPYTNVQLKGAEYHRCCHSNLTRALAAHRGMPLAQAELHVHDVFNIFFCIGFTRDTHQYFMKQTQCDLVILSSCLQKSIYWVRYRHVREGIAASAIPTRPPSAIPWRWRFMAQKMVHSPGGSRRPLMDTLEATE